jgi:NitT/TauT family transport system substrate-binding protein
MQKGLPYARFLLNKYRQPRAEVVPYLGGIAGFLADPLYAQQCFVASEPLAAAKQGHKPDVFMVADEGFNPYTTVLIAREATLKARPALAKAMVEASREGWRAYLDDPKPANAIMARLNPAMDEQTFRDSAQAQRSLVETDAAKADGLGTMRAERWSDLAKQMEALEFVKKAPAPAALFRNL